VHALLISWVLSLFVAAGARLIQDTQQYRDGKSGMLHDLFVDADLVRSATFVVAWVAF